MSITFNADEIFEMAEEIERQGARFYRKAANNAPDPETAQWLNALASMEDGHERTFAEMRTQLTDGEKECDTFDPDGEAAMYLQVMADSHGTEGKKSADQELTGNEPIKEVLEIAISSEKDSVAFYTSMKELVSAGAGRDKVDEIIKEEIGHVAGLTLKLAQVEG